MKIETNATDLSKAFAMTMLGIVNDYIAKETGFLLPPSTAKIIQQGMEAGLKAKGVLGIQEDAKKFDQIMNDFSHIG